MKVSFFTLLSTGSLSGAQDSINFVDLSQIRWKDLSLDNQDNWRLSYIRQKTGGRFLLRLLPPAVAIIDQYRPLTDNGPESYIFPILDHSTHKTTTQINYRLKKILGQVNKDLKAIGEKLELYTPLTTYVARHSFATSLKQSGVATAIISQAMGHKSEAITTVYLDSFDNEIVDAAFDNLL